MGLLDDLARQVLGDRGGEGISADQTAQLAHSLLRMLNGHLLRGMEATR